MVACPFLSRLFGLSLSFSPGNVVGRASVHWACERVLELQCLTVIFCSAHGGQHADTQFLQLLRAFVSVFAWFLGHHET